MSLRLLKRYLELEQRPLFQQLFTAFVFVSTLTVLAITWYANRAVREQIVSSSLSELRVRATLLANQLGDVSQETSYAWQTVIERLHRGVDMRITLIAPDGIVLADSDSDPARMDNHADREEVIPALEGQLAHSQRFSTTTGVQRMYLALPMFDRDSLVTAVLRTSYELDGVDARIRHIASRITMSGMLLALLSCLLGFYISRRFSRPLVRMRQVADDFAAGQLGRRLPPAGTLELNSLASSMNKMAASLDRRLRDLAEQRNEREALLNSMTEGVIAVNREGKLLSCNPAAREMLHLPKDSLRSRHLPTLLGGGPLTEFVDHLLATGDHRESVDLTLQHDTPLHLQVSGSPLQDGQNRRIGVLIVLNDITELRELEGIRKEFVSNVSHELRTPVTSIRGYVETLRDGASTDPEQAAHFLDVIERQANRLNNIIEDLLALSRIERREDHRQLNLQEIQLDHLVTVMVQDHIPIARRKNISLTGNCAPSLVWKLDIIMIERALVNLIINAIHYTDDGGQVELLARETDGHLLLEVKDNGCGISAEHLPRIFERFYVVDKARSRSVGGTGLGLAIVKHVAAAHGGRVEVSSVAGQGSTFRLVLPR